MRALAFRLLIALGLCLQAGSGIAAAAQFLAEIEDLPLAPGLTEQAGGMLFDSAEGRIVEATASGAVTADQVRVFYETSLQQLGWQSIGTLLFRRDTEILRIVLTPEPARLTVHFTLTPTH